MADERPVSVFVAFLRGEAAGGILLMAAAALALVLANSPASGLYFSAFDVKALGLSVEHWINDGLMAVFFLLVGLEIKREMLEGQLAGWSQRVLPGLGALGGMAAPAVVYVACTLGNPHDLKGWAIPTATDIAFALGVMTLLGSRVPASLKVFLTALAIIDDLGAVLIIALFYTAEISTNALAAAGAATGALILLNRLGVRRLWPYLAVGAALWPAMLLSGIHATIAGVVVALAVPLAGGASSPLHRLEHALVRPVGLAIVPLFGFANAGVSLGDVTAAAALGAIPMGVALGLFPGKMIGVFGAVALAIRLGWAKMPDGANLRQLLGTAVLCGIGFTMSLFIGGLAYGGHGQDGDAVKIGVLAGSMTSALLGAAILGTGKPSSS